MRTKEKVPPLVVTYFSQSKFLNFSVKFTIIVFKNKVCLMNFSYFLTYKHSNGYSLIIIYYGTFEIDIDNNDIKKN